MLSLKELKEIQQAKQKAFMFKQHDMPIALTSDEKNLLAKGKETPTDMDREALLSKIMGSGYMEVAKSTNNCCLYSIYFGWESSKLSSPTEKYKVMRPDIGDIISSILDTNYHYFKFLKDIRNKIVRTDESVAFNSKLQ